MELKGITIAKARPFDYLKHIIAKASRFVRAMRYLSLVVLGFLIFLPGCGPDSNKTWNPVGSSGTASAVRYTALPAYGHMLVKGSIADATVLLPVLACDKPSRDIGRLIFNGLLKYDKDIKIVGDLAEKWEVSEDRLRVRFHLRRDVRWHDAQPFTSKDVEYTYKLYADPRTPTAYSSGFMRVKNCRILDDHTVEFTYREPFSPVLRSWAEESIVPSHLLEGNPVTESPLQRHPIGTGPFKFVDWQGGQKIVLDANPDYFEGKPRVGRITIKVIPDLATMFLLLKSGGLDWMDLTPLQFKRQTQTKWFETHFKKYKYLDFSYTYLGYNLKDPKFCEANVRRAITMAIDREGIVRGVLLGLGQVAHSPYKPDSFWSNSNVKKLPYNPVEAQRILTRSGWVDTDGDGIRDKGGRPFEFTIITNQGNPLRERAATIIQRDLKKIGIKVNIRIIEWAALLKHFLHKRNYEAALLGWRLTMDPDQSDIWNSAKTGENELNFGSYKNEEVDRLLEQGLSTFGGKQRKKYYDQFQQLLVQDQPYTFLWVPETTPIIHSRFDGIEPAALGIDYNMPSWFVSQPLQQCELLP